MPNNISIRTDYPRNENTRVDYPKGKFVQSTPGQFVGTSTTYNNSGITYGSTTVQYGGHDGNDGSGPKIAKIIV